jgi:hypothetical protein
MVVLTSRRFWTFVIAQVLTIGTMVFNHYATDPFITQLAPLIISLIEGIAGFVVVAFTVDDMHSNALAAKTDLANIKAGNPTSEDGK